MNRLPSIPAREIETRTPECFQVSGVSWHVIPADILNTMDCPSHRNSFRLRLAHRRLISLHQGEKWQFYCRLPGWLNPSVSLNTAIGDSIETKRGVFGALPGLYRGFIGAVFAYFDKKVSQQNFPKQDAILLTDIDLYIFNLVKQIYIRLRAYFECSLYRQWPTSFGVS